MTNEEGNAVPIEGKWKLGGTIMSGCCFFSYILSAAGVMIMACNMGDYNHRLIQFATILAYATTGLLFGAAISYEFLSRDERTQKRYDTQVGPYIIERNWMWSTSYLCVSSAAILSLLAAVSAFCSTLEALVCADDPYEGCKHCFTCSQKSHAVVTPFVMPTCPSQGMHQEGIEEADGDLRHGGGAGSGAYSNNKAVRLPPLLGRPGS